MIVQAIGPLEAQYAGWCLSCGTAIKVGQKVYWAKMVGTWHEGCDRPRSLEMYAREAEQKRKMGFGR